MKQLLRRVSLIAAIVLPPSAAFAAPNTVQFDPATYTVAESTATVTVRVTRTGADLSSASAVNYATANGHTSASIYNAIAGDDYEAASGTLTFAPGETEKTIDIQIINDAAEEEPQDFTVFLSSPSGVALGSPQTATVTIADDNSTTSTMQFDRSSYTVREDDGSVVLVVNRSGNLLKPASVTFSTSDDTTTAGSDYAASSGTVQFAPNEIRKIVAIKILNDSVQEDDETFDATLASPSAGDSLGDPERHTTAVTITDDDSESTVQFDPANYFIDEAAGNAVLTINANRSGDPNTVITVSYATRDGTATAGQDYSAKQGTVTFNAGEAQKQIAIAVTNDSLVENAERFFVDLSNPTNAKISATDATATVTIEDDDSLTGSIGFDPNSYEVGEGARSVTLTITRSTGLGFHATVHYDTHDGTAVAGSNYVATSGTVTLQPGETSKDIKVRIIDNTTFERDLHFTVTLSDSSGATFVDPQRDTATVVIVDNDANKFRFRSATYNVEEGSGSVTLTVDLQRSGDPEKSVTIDYATLNGTAHAGSKYRRTAGRLTFGGGITSQTITVPIINNSRVDPNTYFSVVLSNPLPSTGDPPSRLGSPSSAKVTIIDDDQRTFQFTSSNYTVANSSAVADLTVTFSRAGDPNGTYSVHYSTFDGTAHAGKDYRAKAGTLTFRAGETSQTIRVPIVQQRTGQPNREFGVSLFEPSGDAVVGEPSEATVTITNPDFSTKLLNLSTRGPVGSGDDVMIAGFVLRGTSAKALVLRGLGPSLTRSGVPGALADPTLTLIDANGKVIAYNDNYGANSASDRKILDEIGLTPFDPREAALITVLRPGRYTEILRGKGPGAGLVEVYDVTPTLSTKLVNISTRGIVREGDNGAMIGGFIVRAPLNRPGTPQRVVIRAIGPSLKNYGVSGALADTRLEIYRGSQKILENDNWTSNSEQDRDALQSMKLAPADDHEAAIITTLDPGSYSAVVRGKDDSTGVALVEVYQLNR